MTVQSEVEKRELRTSIVGPILEQIASCELLAAMTALYPRNGAARRYIQGKQDLAMFQQVPSDRTEIAVKNCVVLAVDEPNRRETTDFAVFEQEGLPHIAFGDCSSNATKWAVCLQ
jgi:hypothetical protein